MWEINNWGHSDLTGQGRGLRLLAGHRLNLRNGAAFAEAAAHGCSWCVLSLEATREELQELRLSKYATRIVLPVYSWPPLFTSRLNPGLSGERPFLSPRKEAYHLTSQAGHTEIYSDRPVSWLEQLPFLRSLGYRNFLLDSSDGPEKRSDIIENVLKGFAGSRSPGNYSVFNLDRRL